jgi:hypothetical protein
MEKRIEKHHKIFRILNLLKRGNRWKGSFWEALSESKYSIVEREKNKSDHRKRRRNFGR